MNRENINLERALQSSLQKRVEEPSVNVLRGLRRRLWISDFFSINPRKVNIAYTLAVLAGIVSLTLTNTNSDKSNESHTPQASTNIVKSTIPASEVISEKIDVLDDVNNSTKEFVVKESAEMLMANFEAEIIQGCAPLEVNFNDKSVLAKKWKWRFGNGEESSKRNPNVIYNKPGTYQAVLTVTGIDGNKSSYEREILVLSRPQASFNIDLEKSDVSKRKVLFKNESVGAKTYMWDFGDQEISKQQLAEHVYSDYGVFKVSLIAKAENGCSDTVKIINKFIEKDYTISFPLNFRPNPYKSGNNGYYESAGEETGIFYPRHSGAKEYELKVYTSNGIEVFKTSNIKQGWNGYMRGRLAPAGTYQYEAMGIYPNGQKFNLSGKLKVTVDHRLQENF